MRSRLGDRAICSGNLGSGGLAAELPLLAAGFGQGQCAATQSHPHKATLTKPPSQPLWPRVPRHSLAGMHRHASGQAGPAGVCGLENQRAALAQRTLPLEGSSNSTPGLGRKSLCGPRWVCADRGSHTTPPVPTPPPVLLPAQGTQVGQTFSHCPPLPTHTHHGKRVSLPLSPPGPLGPPRMGVGGAISPGCLWAAVPQMLCSAPDIVVIWTFHIKVIN